MYSFDEILHNILGWNIMHIRLNINTDVKINGLTDLPKLKALSESSNMKINKSQLARELEVDRRTIEKYLNGYTRKSTRNRTSKIDKFYDTIQSLLSDESPQVFYYKRVLWQYLKDNHGLDSSLSNFRAYISKKQGFQQYFDTRRGRVANKEIIRFETLPAEQAQLDWKENIKYITKDGEVLYVNVLVLLLSYSRFRVFLLSISKSQTILLSFLTECFEAIGGVPKTILVDNMKTVMDEPRTAYKKGKVNERFYQFAKDFGFEVKPCIAGRPQTKAKVEAPMKILDEIHAYQGQFNYEELNQFVGELCNRVNHEYNQGTGGIPVLSLQKEKDLLPALPSKRIRDAYRISHTLVKVNTANMFTFKSNQYSVPAGYIGKTLSLQVYDNRLFVYYSTDLIVQHEIRQRKLNYKREHYVEAMANQLPYKEDIEELALKNLAAIDEVYGNE
jgi:transposase